MTRSLWKGPFSDMSVFISIQKKKVLLDGEETDSFLQSKNEIRQKIWSRRSVILPQFIGKQFMIHNGKTFIPLKVTPDMVGHKMGEFATTRKKPIHKKKNKK
jgi:small subunit ribosomal protein S19